MRKNDPYPSMPHVLSSQISNKFDKFVSALLALLSGHSSPIIFYDHTSIYYEGVMPDDKNIIISTG